MITLEGSRRLRQSMHCPHCQSDTTPCHFLVRFRAGDRDPSQRIEKAISARDYRLGAGMRIAVLVHLNY